MFSLINLVNTTALKKDHIVSLHCQIKLKSFSRLFFVKFVEACIETRYNSTNVLPESMLMVSCLPAKSRQVKSYNAITSPFTLVPLFNHAYTQFPLEWNPFGLPLWPHMQNTYARTHARALTGHRNVSFVHASVC